MKFGKCWWRVQHGHRAEALLTFAQEQIAELGFANTRRIRQNCLKYGLQVARRT